MSDYEDELWWGVQNAEGRLVATFEQEDDACEFAKTLPKGTLCLTEPSVEAEVIDDESS